LITNLTVIQFFRNIERVKTQRPINTPLFIYQLWFIWRRHDYRVWRRCKMSVELESPHSASHRPLFITWPCILACNL